MAVLKLVTVHVLFYCIQTNGQPPVGPNGIASPMVPPLPPMDCAGDNGANRKYVNDTCITDQECGAPMHCVKELCNCPDQYLERPVVSPNGTRYECVNTPSLLNQPCMDVCQKPLTCSSNQTSIRPISNSSNSGRARATGVCVCLPPAVVQSGVCILECQKDEIYRNGVCEKRCTANEVRVGNEGCKKRAAVGEPCEESQQCTAAYSECSRGTCQCKDGLSANNGKCESKTYTCPFGEPAVSGGSIVNCSFTRSTIMMGSITTQHLEDSCPDGQFCLVHGTNGFEGAPGHCCPKPKPQCPIGVPHPNATCHPKPGVRAMPCPRFTHYCASSGIAGLTGLDSVCCPQACGVWSVHVDGQCLPQVQYGDTCSADEQCRSHNGVCRGGVCQCQPGATAEGGINKLCRLQCKPDQIELGNECQTRLKLGETCQPETMLCPQNAFCNSKSVCACRCGTQPIGDAMCGLPPTCNLGGMPRPMPMPMQPRASSLAITSANGNDQDKPVQPVQNASTITYCKESPGAMSPVPSAVDKCDNGLTCTYYMQNLGICCPTPKPYCPPGQQALDEKCDIRTGCISGGTCFRYFIPANRTDTSLGNICCTQATNLPTKP